MGIISTSFHAETENNDEKLNSKMEESNADANANVHAHVRGKKSTDGHVKAGMEDEDYSNNERLLPSNQPPANITNNSNVSNTKRTTKQQPSSHTGLATQLRSVVGKAKQLQTSISTGSESLGEVIRQAKSSGSKHMISSSSPYDEEQFEEEEEGDEGFEGEDEEQEEEEVIDDDDRVTMPSTEMMTHHHDDGDDHLQSPHGYDGRYDVSESSIMVDRSIDSCADYIEDVPPSDDDDDEKHMIEEVLSDGEIEEEEEMKEQFRRRNVRWSGNSITSENSAVVTARSTRSSTRSSSARQTSARNSAARLLHL